MNRSLLPNIIIGGVTRSATTSLFTYLSWHPEICPSRIKETEYFTPMIVGKRLPPLDNYEAYFKQCRKINSKYIMEASPGYIYGGKEIAIKINQCLGSPKIIFVFRDPIDRLLSHYNYAKKFGAFEERFANISFDEYVCSGLEEIDKREDRLSDCFNPYHETFFVSGIVASLYVIYLVEWYSVFDDSIKVFFFEHLKESPICFMEEVCSWLDIEPALYHSISFSIENRTIQPKKIFIYNIAEGINMKFEAFFRRHHLTKRMLREIYCFINESRKKEQSLSESTYKHLESFYAPYNKRLHKILRFKSYSNLPSWLEKYG